MLIQIFFSEAYSGLSFAEKLLYALISILVITVSLTVHEVSHGFAAYKLGDSTAKSDGRLSLNPLAHLDPVGTIMLLLIGFGYAKPVPVMTRNFKKPRRDFAIVSLAGPLSNFLLAFLSAFIYVLLYKAAPEEFFRNTVGLAVLEIFSFGIIINIGLGLFNLIPLPPLDGSNVLMCILPSNVAAKYAKLRFYTRYIILAIIALSWISPTAYSYVFYPLTFLRTAITEGFISFWAMVFGL